MSEFSLSGQKLYRPPILELCSRDIVGYPIQAWHYQHKRYQQTPREKGIQQSMSRKGSCRDNAVVENFFGLLKGELFRTISRKSEWHKMVLIEYLS